MTDQFFPPKSPRRMRRQFDPHRLLSRHRARRTSVARGATRGATRVHVDARAKNRSTRRRRTRRGRRRATTRERSRARCWRNRRMRPRPTSPFTSRGNPRGRNAWRGKKVRDDARFCRGRVDATRRDARGRRPRVHRADASEISFARAVGARPARGLRDVDFILMVVLSITIRVWARFTFYATWISAYPSVHRGEKDRRNRRYLSIESIHPSSDSA